MRKFMVICSVQDGLFNDAQCAEIENGILSVYRQCFSIYSQIKVIWMTVPQGQAYLAGKPSNCSTLAVSVTDGLPHEDRSFFLHIILKKWIQITRCNESDIVISALDVSQIKKLMKLNQRRFRPSLRVFMFVKMISTLLRSQYLKGRLEMSINQTKQLD